MLCTFGVLGNGQVLYMSSPSEIQRMSLVSNDRYDHSKQQYTLWAYGNILWDFPYFSSPICRLNLPACLPDVYIHLKDPQPVSRKKYTAVNREHLCKCISCVEVDSDPHIDLHAWYWVLLQASWTLHNANSKRKAVVLVWNWIKNVIKFEPWSVPCVNMYVWL